MRIIFLLPVLIAFSSCTKDSKPLPPGGGVKRANPVRESKEGTVETITGQIVKKDFINKGGRKIDGVNDLFFRTSMADYFIKFCESKVERKDLEKYVDKAAKLEIIKKEGEWDVCEKHEYEVQSRIGEYISVIKIVE